ncbi:uncharacterized protein BDZ83DRAFT_637943 [Colletotrichum acutatum]|uniref:Uncharacterized protein n=1 Tax=Glomerella acutata TaxID=27357 RepID=A0AAD8UDH6_GLOAC|nr:uncharacterized protein BDZ83DRAFT_637943 [Colletotrichum acutatum]KAK1712952.1 hypothetical protein BDZ83DRAFT_637943 [Colletotrichum acutatum]
MNGINAWKGGWMVTVHDEDVAYFSGGDYFVRSFCGVPRTKNLDCKIALLGHKTRAVSDTAM